MKKIFLTLVALALATSAQAAPLLGVHFTNNTTNSSAVVVKTANYRTKTLSVSGVSGSSFANFSGTIVAYAGPTTSGPWHASAQQHGTAASVTGNGGISWDSAATYTRLVFTKSARGARAFKAWLMGLEN